MLEREKGELGRGDRTQPRTGVLSTQEPGLGLNHPHQQQTGLALRRSGCGIRVGPAGQPQPDLALQKGIARSCWWEGRRGLVSAQIHGLFEFFGPQEQSAGSLPVPACSTVPVPAPRTPLFHCFLHPTLQPQNKESHPFPPLPALPLYLVTQAGGRWQPPCSAWLCSAAYICC